MRFAAAALLLASSLSAQPKPRPWTDLYGEEAAAATTACAVAQIAECRTHLLRLKDLLDGRGDIIYRLGKLEETAGNAEEAARWFALYSKMGLQLGDPARNPPATSVTTSKLFATLPEKDLIAEDIAWDPKGARFYISSARRRKILAMTRDGKFTDFLPAADWPILALAVDATRRVLWATTAAMPEGLDYKPADEGKSALLKLSLDSAKLLQRYDLPSGGKHALGDMTLSPAGDVYVSDGYGAVYQVDHQRDRIELLIGPGVFRSPQTPALAPDGRRLFVPDYSRGISVVDLATKESKLLEHPADLSLGGIDGLYLNGTSLIAIQNGTAPPRVIRLKLDPGLTKILSWETLEANWKGLGDPTHGVQISQEFYFIANSGWEVKSGGTYEAPTIRVIH
jgi:sugar lactone lactonase YvrE